MACFYGEPSFFEAEDFKTYWTGAGWGASGWRFESSKFYLTRCVYQLVLESQLPHKTVNLIF